MSRQIGFVAKQCLECGAIYNGYNPLNHTCVKGTKKPKEMILTAEEARALVIVTAGRCSELILRDLEKHTPKQKWLLFGRIVSLLYGQFFSIALSFGNEELDKIQKDLK